MGSNFMGGIAACGDRCGYHVTEEGNKTRQILELKFRQTRPQAQASTIMSNAEVASAAPRRSQRDKKQVDRFGSGAYSPSRSSHNGISPFWIP